MPRTTGIVVSVLIGLLITNMEPAVRALAQDGAAQVTPTKKIPPDYKSWSLFLICNPSWIVDKGDQGIADLFKAYKAFGEAIGDKNLAVWFLKKDNQPPTVANADISRMSSYCQEYGLVPSKTPQVVATTRYPDDAAGSYDYVVVNLGTNASESALSLTALTDQLLRTGLNQANLNDNERWTRFISAGEAAFNTAGCLLNRMSLSINVGVAKVELASKIVC
jgi:hypothetical protein